MALDTAPLLTRKRNLAFALEATNGVIASLGAADGVTNVFNCSMKFSTEAVEREGQGNLSPIPQGRGGRSGTCEFETELVGSGVTAIPIQSRLFQGCGCTVSGGVITPLTAPQQTLSLGYYTHGRLKKLAGCMGNFVITARRGQKARVKWTFTGVQEVPSDVSIITPTYQTVVAPRCGGTFTIGGTAHRAPDLEFDAGNEVVLREDLSAVESASNPTGYRCAYITNRRPMAKTSPEALLYATKNWHAVYNAGTTSALSLVVGAAANNTMTLAAPTLELFTDPEDADRNGLLADSLQFLCLRGTDAGDDEWSLTYS